MMLTRDGDEMSLTPDAENVCADLVRLGAVPTSGHRTVAGQAHAMSVSVVQNRDWIGQTYRHGAALQGLITAHPEWITAERIGEELYRAMMLDGMGKDISHHLLLPCPCFDLSPSSLNDEIRARIKMYQFEGVITQVLYKEGGVPKCHVECQELPINKVEYVDA